MVYSKGTSVAECFNESLFQFLIVEVTEQEESTYTIPYPLCNTVRLFVIFEKKKII